MAVEHAAIENIPLSGSKQGKKEKTMTGWNETVRPKQNDAKFWHAVGLSADKPANGELFKLLNDNPCEAVNNSMAKIV